MPVSDLDKVGRDVGEDGAPEGHEDAETTPDVLTQLQEQAGRHMFWAVTAVSHLFAMLRFATPCSLTATRWLYFPAYSTTMSAALQCPRCAPTDWRPRDMRLASVTLFTMGLLFQGPEFTFELERQREFDIRVLAKKVSTVQERVRTKFFGCGIHTFSN